MECSDVILKPLLLLCLRGAENDASVVLFTVFIENDKLCDLIWMARLCPAPENSIVLAPQGGLVLVLFGAYDHRFENGVRRPPLLGRVLHSPEGDLSGLEFGHVLIGASACLIHWRTSPGRR